MFSSPTSVRDHRTHVLEGPTVEQVRALQGVAEHPCVSVLLPTTAGASMAPGDVERLRSALVHVARRLDREERSQERAALLEHLGALALDAAQAPTAAALALYVSASTSTSITLPLTVRERVVIDASFATRDLVRCQHRVPRHLVLGAERTHLFEAVDGTLAEVQDVSPVLRSTAPAPEGRRPGSRDRGARSYLSAVDRALGVFLAAAPAPLVLVGPDSLLTAFQARSRHLARLAGVITDDHAGASVAELLALARLVLDEHLHSRQREALELIDAAAGAGQVARGMPAAWAAAHRGHPQVLAVEDTLFYPARTSGPGGETITAARDVEHPDVVDDAVDELIELVLRRGGSVALVDEGTLATSGGVALATAQRS